MRWTEDQIRRLGRTRVILFSLGVLLAGFLLPSGCDRSEPGVLAPGRSALFEVTAYCACEKCCSWTRDSQGRPIFANGPLKGKHKVVGICADGTRAREGVAAADTRYYPFKSRFWVPGYGVAVVHDTGGAIKGPARLDLYFESHQQALEWGRQFIVVQRMSPDY